LGLLSLFAGILIDQRESPHLKLDGAVGDHDVRHLHWLADKLSDELLDAAVITCGPAAYRRKDGIAVIPAALLGP